MKRKLLDLGIVVTLSACAGALIYDLIKKGKKYCEENPCGCVCCGEDVDEDDDDEDEIFVDDLDEEEDDRAAESAGE